MADTIVISPISEPAQLGQRGAQHVSWRCLSRRGMVFSELEGFEYMRIAPGSVLLGAAHPYTEIVLFTISGDGSIEVEPHTRAIRPRDAVMLPAGGEYALLADSQQPLELATVELIPDAIANRLPYRTPQLVELPEPRRAV
jgi:quercetin dioxygenase-like cupin family protein